MILKILVTAGLIYIVYIAFFKKPSLQSSKTSKEDNELIDEMVACAHCGTYISNDESIISLGKTYCSAECIKDDT